jgi:hypothetical protein
MEKTSIIPGATKVTDEMGNQMFDGKGRPLWNPAEPIKHVTHFKSAGMRRLYENGEITLQQATHNVPVYRGVPIEVVRVIRNYHRRQKMMKRSFIDKGFESVQEGAQQARERIAGMKKRAMAKKGLEASQKAQQDRKDPSTLTTAMAAELVDQHGSVRAAAAASGFSRDAISRRLARRK